MHVTKVKKTICHGYRPHISTTWHSQNSKIIEIVKRSKVTRCYEYAATAAIKSLQSCPTVWPHRREPTRLPSLEFSRQEHWSGLPFPSPMHESEKWQWRRSVSTPTSKVMLEGFRSSIKSFELLGGMVPQKNKRLFAHVSLKYHGDPWNCITIGLLSLKYDIGIDYSGWMQVPGAIWVKFPYFYNELSSL